jgi:hypothetical protein
MKLKGVLISQLRDFKENFSFHEVWSKINHFLIECSPEEMLYSEKDTRLFAVIDICINNTSDKAVNFALSEDGNLIFSEEDRLALEYVKYSKALSLKKVFEKYTLLHNAANSYFAILALYELAERNLDDTDIIMESFNPKAGSDLEKLKNESEGAAISHSDRMILEFENSDKPYQIKQYSFKKSTDYEIKTRKLINVSKSAYGRVTIHITGEDDCILKTVHLKHGDSIYANFIEDELIELLPTISCSDTNYIYLTKDINGQKTLGKYVYESEANALYPSDDLKGITQFMATDDKGFVGIAGGKIITYTSTKINACDLKDEIPVYFCTRGASYLILTNKGNVYSNRNFNPKGIISVYFDEYYSAYAITAEGKVISDNQKFEPINHYNNVVSIRSCNDKIALRTIHSDIILVDCTLGREHIKKQSSLTDLNVNSGEIYALDHNKVTVIDTEKVLLNDINEFDLTDDYIVCKSEEYIYCLDLYRMRQLKSVKYS